MFCMSSPMMCLSYLGWEPVKSHLSLVLVYYALSAVRFPHAFANKQRIYIIEERSGGIYFKDTVYPLSMIFYKAIFSVIIINSQ